MVILPHICTNSLQTFTIFATFLLMTSADNFPKPQQNTNPRLYHCGEYIKIPVQQFKSVSDHNIGLHENGTKLVLKSQINI